jgi:hypothetical protein
MNNPLSLLRLLQSRQATALRRRQQSDAPVTAPAVDKALPDRPSLEGYTIQELRTEQLAHLIKLEELQPREVERLVRALTRPHQ